MWVLVLTFSTGITWSAKRYLEGYKPENIVLLTPPQRGAVTLQRNRGTRFAREFIV
jgi:hypothetical protein